MRVAHLLPRQRGNVAVDNYRFVNALLWMCRTGAPWRDLPECYGKWITVCRRFNRWSGNGAMERLFAALQEERIIGVEIRVLAMDSTDDVRELTHASSLGTVPQAAILDDSRPVVVAQPAGSEAEEFRRIRTNLSFLTTTATQGHGRLLVITSTDPSEGKTTVSSNVAVALAEEGKSVLLIDADLRHPSVAHKLGIEGHVGLSHVLSRQASPADVIQKYWKPNLHIMPAGKRPANASILLNSDLMKEMVEQALTQYDYVIIDTAPLSVASDATVFGRMAGGLVLVTGKGVVEKKELRSTATALQTAEVPILGFIFNFADPKKIHSKNYYYYYYEDGNKRSSHKGAKSKG